MTIYLDYAATTPIRPEVLDCYVENLKTLGNPSSVHSAGQKVRRALEEAREEIARSVDCDRNEVIFTAGGTESNNLAIKGLFWKQRDSDAKKNLIISAGTEHHAVIDPIEWLEQHEGAEVIWLGVDRDGVVNFQELENLLELRNEEVALISLMWANNETGIITDIRKVTELATKYSIPVHSDAVAAFGHIETSFKDSGLAAMSISAHKVGGPVGVGALIVARSAKLVSLTHGGGQERGLRAGTMNAPAAKAFALAATKATEELEVETNRLKALRDSLIAQVTEVAPNARLTGSDSPRMSHNAHFIFEGCSGDSLLFLLDQQGIEVSTGSACQAGVNGPSHVLVAMGRTIPEAYGCIRITMGSDSTENDVKAFIDALPKAIEGALKAGIVNTGAN